MHIYLYSSLFLFMIIVFVSWTIVVIMGWVCFTVIMGNVCFFFFKKNFGMFYILMMFFSISFGLYSCYFCKLLGLCFMHVCRLYGMYHAFM